MEYRRRIGGGASLLRPLWTPRGGAKPLLAAPTYPNHAASMRRDSARALRGALTVGSTKTG